MISGRVGTTLQLLLLLHAAFSACTGASPGRTAFPTPKEPTAGRAVAAERMANSAHARVLTMPTAIIEGVDTWEALDESISGGVAIDSKAGHGASYGLDHYSRKTPVRGREYCPEVETLRYAGEVVPFNKPLRVYVEFAERLRRFERIVADVALEIYGRTPTAIHHYGPNR